MGNKQTTTYSEKNNNKKIFERIKQPEYQQREGRTTRRKQPEETQIDIKKRFERENEIIRREIREQRKRIREDEREIREQENRIREQRKRIREQENRIREDEREIREQINRIREIQTIHEEMERFQRILREFNINNNNNKNKFH